VIFENSIFDFCCGGRGFFGRVRNDSDREDALADLKKEAANKGANFLVVRQYSAMGTAVTGEAYLCP